MARLTAAEIKAKNAPFPKTIPGLGGEVLLRRPSVRRMIYAGLMPLPLLSDASRLLASWVGQDLTKLETKEEGARHDDAERLLNLAVADVMVEPRCVATGADPGADDPDTLVAAALDIEVREAIVLAALSGPEADAADAKEESAQAAEFPEERPGA